MPPRKNTRRPQASFGSIREQLFEICSNSERTMRDVRLIPKIIHSYIHNSRHNESSRRRRRSSEIQNLPRDPKSDSESDFKLMHDFVNLPCKNFIDIDCLPVCTAANSYNDTTTTPLLHVLHELGADLNGQDTYGYTALHFLCREGHLDAVQSMLSHYGDILDVNLQELTGHTPLMLAARGNHEEIVKLLLKQQNKNLRPDLFVKNKRGKTARGLAQQRNFRSVASYLRLCMQQAIDTDSKSNNRARTTARDQRAPESPPPPPPPPPAPMYASPQKPIRNETEVLVEDSIVLLINVCCNANRTWDDVKMVSDSLKLAETLASDTARRIVASHPFEVGALSKLKTTWSNDSKVAADIDIDTIGCCSPICACIEHYDGVTSMPLAKTLIQHGANVNKQFKQHGGRNALMLAARHGQADIVRCLMSDGKANASLANDRGWTPIMYGAWNGHVNVIECLVKEFAVKYRMKNNRGKTAYDLAVSRRHRDVVKFLKSNPRRSYKLSTTVTGTVSATKS
jgi:ankyrin repeat protein